MKTLASIRADHPTLHYQRAHYELVDGTITITFTYLIEPNLEFTHTHSISNLPATATALPKETLQTAVAYVGLAELFSYWKLTASPTIHNHVVQLSEEQSQFWLNLLKGGMGEYFYVNDINFTAPDFVKLVTDPAAPQIQAQPVLATPTPQVLVPLGGGKDSVVTLDFFQKNLAAGQLGTLLVNPTQAAQDIAAQAGVPQVVVSRTLDPKLFELNAQGYLNGHVPISSVFAFTAQLVCLLFGYTHVAISNERSSNEGNVLFHGQEINHQYSKSYEFETAFRKYQTHLYGQHAPSYFSYLRPLYELQIAQLFAAIPEYHQVFRSCNRGQKTNSWCGECPKCLSAFLLLYPFIPEETLQSNFSKNLFEDEGLYPLLLALLGKDTAKPFECVGTYEESLAALYLCVKHARSQRADLPVVLARAQSELLHQEENMAQRAQTILTAWNQEHHIPNAWETWLQKELS